MQQLHSANQGADNVFISHGAANQLGVTQELDITLTSGHVYGVESQAGLLFSNSGGAFNDHPHEGQQHSTAPGTASHCASAAVTAVDETDPLQSPSAQYSLPGHGVDDADTEQQAMEVERTELQDASSEQLILQPQAVAIRYLDVVAEKVIIQHPEIPTGSVTGKKLLDAGVLLFKGASGGHAKVKWPTPGKPEPEAKHCGNTNTAAYALKRMRPDWREALGLPPSTLIKPSKKRKASQPAAGDAAKGPNREQQMSSVLNPQQQQQQRQEAPPGMNSQQQHVQQQQQQQRPGASSMDHPQQQHVQQQQQPSDASPMRMPLPMAMHQPQQHHNQPQRDPKAAQQQWQQVRSQQHHHQPQQGAQQAAQQQRQPACSQQTDKHAYQELAPAGTDTTGQQPAGPAAAATARASIPAADGDLKIPLERTIQQFSDVARTCSRLETFEQLVPAPAYKKQVGDPAYVVELGQFARQQHAAMVSAWDNLPRIRDTARLDPAYSAAVDAFAATLKDKLAAATQWLERERKYIQELQDAEQVCEWLSQKDWKTKDGDHQQQQDVSEGLGRHSSISIDQHQNSNRCKAAPPDIANAQASSSTEAPVNDKGTAAGSAIAGSRTAHAGANAPAATYPAAGVDARLQQILSDMAAGRVSGRRGCADFAEPAAPRVAVDHHPDKRRELPYGDDAVGGSAGSFRMYDDDDDDKLLQQQRCSSRPHQATGYSRRSHSQEQRQRLQSFERRGGNRRRPPAENLRGMQEPGIDLLQPRLRDQIEDLCISSCGLLNTKAIDVGVAHQLNGLSPESAQAVLDRLSKHIKDKSLQNIANISAFIMAMCNRQRSGRRSRRLGTSASNMLDQLRTLTANQSRA